MLIRLSALSEYDIIMNARPTCTANANSELEDSAEKLKLFQIGQFGVTFWSYQL